MNTKIAFIVALCVCQIAKAQDLKVCFQMVQGKGVCLVEGASYAVGNDSLLLDLGPKAKGNPSVTVICSGDTSLESLSLFRMQLAKIGFSQVKYYVASSDLTQMSEFVVSHPLPPQPLPTWYKTSVQIAK